MSTIHLHQTTTSTPEQYLAGLTDFGPGRSKLFGNSANAYLKVHRRGARGRSVSRLLGSAKYAHRQTRSLSASRPEFLFTFG